MFKGREITRLMVIAALCCVLMTAAVTAYLVASSRQHLKSQSEKMEQALADSIARKLDASFDNITNYLKQTPSIPASEQAYVLINDPKRVVAFLTGCAWAMFDCDYAMDLDKNGEIYISFVKEGKTIEDFPLDLVMNIDAASSESQYEIVDSIAGNPGPYIILVRDSLMPTTGQTVRLGLIINASEQVAALSQAYDEEKSDMVARQVIVSTIIFLVFLALSILVIYFAIRRRLSGPIAAINDSARGIMSGKDIEAAEPDEKSIFYNLQLLLKSGSVIFRKSGQSEEVVTAKAAGKGGSEVRKVLVFWIVIFFVISAVSVAALVATSITMMNSKTNDLKQDVVRQTAEFYKKAQNSTMEYVLKTGGNLMIGQSVWDTDPNATFDRARTMEDLRNLLKASYDAEYVIYALEQEPAYSTEGTTDLPGLPEKYAEGYIVLSSLDGQEGTYIALCKKTDYPIYPADQYVYTIVDITTQADAINQLYEDSLSQLLWSQLVVAFILLVLSALLAAFGIGWAVQRFVAAPVRELDELSSRVMDGSLEKDVAVDEGSSFADIQRLLRQAQELLRRMDTG